VGALRAHGRRLLADLMAAQPSRSISEMLLVTGRSLRRSRDSDGYLVIEALVAARRDEDVAAPMRDYVRERADWLADLVRTAQDRGEIDPALSPAAIAHFCLSLAAGTALVTPDLNDVDDQEWTAFVARIVTALAPANVTQTGATP
jgi:hypothetical protein